MAGPQHTLSAKCRLAPIHRPWNKDNHGSTGVPPVNAQYFYSSPISINDPLSPSLIAASADARSSRGPLRPFSRGDNNALDQAWLSIADDRHRQGHQRILDASGALPSLHPEDAECLSHLIHTLARKHAATHATGKDSPRPATPASPVANDTPIPVCCPALSVDVRHELGQLFCPLVLSRHRSLRQESVTQDIMTHMRACSMDRNKTLSSPRTRRSFLPARDGDDASAWRNPAAAAGLPRPSTPQSPSSKASPSLAIPIRLPNADDGVTGKPFARLPSSASGDQISTSASLRRVDPSVLPRSTEKRSSLASLSSSKVDSKPSTPVPGGGRSEGSDSVSAANTNTNPGRENDGGRATDQADKQKGPDTFPGQNEKSRGPVEVPVGVSRLHMVSLPELQMKPIYWSPVNDIAVVLRATWFYSDTMVPVDPMVANQLEAGYQELKPHTETWTDELRCAVEVGPLGEEKVVHRLWPVVERKQPSRSSELDDDPEPPIPRDPDCAARCCRGEAAAEGRLEGPIPAKEARIPSRPFSSYHVVYKDAVSAFLLKPSLRPSAYYGRKPVTKILKGHPVGIPVQRGFDWDVWDRVQEKKKGTSSKSHDQPASNEPSDTQPGSTSSDGCEACRLDKERGQVTDLVFVAHGIGQKFAERVESFHFTHAINAFRREINIQLGSDEVKSVLRDGQNGIMLLPINWRHTLSFEDGGPMREEDKSAYMPEGFSLKDIEPTSIPAVRSIISDVMFDIPFYMSHHKRKMIEALVTEANRVYRLWCRNNPGFAEKGRVHLIGHSLGSAMALEVLSRQPTQLAPLNLDEVGREESSFFEFDTKNLFLLGSPAGFFLLLERGALMPRRGRLKPGADPLDVEANDVVGEKGFFGCLAVDNVYNILAKEDPIAYLLNATVDPAYAASLKVAYAPSAVASLLKTMGDAVRTLVPGMQPGGSRPADTAKPPNARLPSQLELEVHDFTREEIAEKKAYLLNDNGQIDFYLRSGGGPLEMQYLNMLSAHTSYWSHQDLIRMLCMEIGRKPGREHTLPSMRAVKITKRMASALAG